MRSASPLWRDRLRRRLNRAGPDAVVVIVALALGSVVVAVLERVGGFDNGSPAFILAVVAVAVLRGTGPAVAAAIGSFLVYDFLFIEPLYTLTVRDPGEWLNLLLLLVVGRRRRAPCRPRARPRRCGDRTRARGTRAVQRQLHPRHGTGSGSGPGPIARMVCDEADADPRLDHGRRSDRRRHRARRQPAARNPAVHATLRRRPGDEPAEWVRVHAPAQAQKATQSRDETAYRVAITAGDRTLGSIWVTRPRGLGDPTTARRASSRPPPTRSVDRSSATGSCARRHPRRSRGGARPSSRRCSTRSRTTCERRSRPIRAAAGMLMDPDVDWPPERAPGDRRLHRPRGRVAESTGHQPPRHESGRGRRAPAEPRGLRSSRPSRPRPDPHWRRLERPRGRRSTSARGPPAGPGRRGVHRPDPREHPRQRRQVRRPGRADPGLGIGRRRTGASR